MSGSRPAWSYSALEMYRTCPKQYQEVRVLKNWKDMKTAERSWGDDVHEALKEYLQSGKPLPPGMEVWQGIAQQFRNLKGTLLAEQQFCLNENLQPTSWFAKDAWVRVIIDGAWINGRIAKLIDWKTGKPKRGSDQLALFALAIFYLYPDVEEVRTMFVWLKNGTTTPETFKREDIPRLWQLFMPDVLRMEESYKNNVWPAKTSGLCSQWCPVLTCQYNGKRRNWDK